jgi:hypothetical protein
MGLGIHSGGKIKTSPSDLRDVEIIHRKGKIMKKANTDKIT